MLKFGKQWVMSDSFVVDLYFGVGYGLSTEGDFDIGYGFAAGNADVPIAATAGMRIGWAF